MTKPVLEAIAVSRSYADGHRNVHALRDTSLAVDEGEFVAIMGPSGSGKSTLLHLLGALDQPSSGVVRIGGSDLAGLSRAELARVRAHQVGFVFQAFNLIPGLSARDNVALPALLAGERRADAIERSNVLLSEVGLAEQADEYPSRLSGGEQQRVAVARSLVMRPAVLLADEPTGNLDSQSGRDVMALIEGSRSSVGCIVVVTHDQRIAARADRIVYLRDGTVVDDVRTARDATSPPRPPDRLIETGDLGRNTTPARD